MGESEIMNKINKIICGDCLDVLKKIESDSIDLIYLDPPFFSQKHYENFWIERDAKGKEINESLRRKVEFSDKDWEQFKSKIDPNLLKEYEHIEERWKGGHKGIYVYIAYMRERIDRCYRVLKSTGSIYLHCDYHAGHYLKEMMDEVFGYDNFRNEIIWKRTNSPKAQTNGFGSQHDTILFYTKSENFTFNKIYRKHDEKSLSSYNLQDDKGKFQTVAIIAGGSQRYPGRKEISFHGVTAPWLYSIEKLEEFWNKGLIYKTSGGLYRLKKYIEDTKGILLSDIWVDNEVNPIQGISKEHLGYPTQKSEALLERIIKASSNEDDIVLDPFCGCGTTIAVAKRLNRQFIGIDISRIACSVMKSRLGNVEFVGENDIEELKKMDPHEFARYIIVEKFGGEVSQKKSGDMGIDGWKDYRTVPVQVKRWGHKVGRPEIDKFKTAVERVRKTYGIIVAFDFSKDCYEEVARIEKEHKIKIELKKVKDVIND